MQRSALCTAHFVPLLSLTQVNEEFRLIERIKEGDWEGLVARGGEETEEDSGNPFAPPVGGGDGGRDDGGGNKFGGVKAMNGETGLFEGRQLPSGIGGRNGKGPPQEEHAGCRSGSGSLGGSSSELASWDSCGRQDSSLMGLGSSLGSSREGEADNERPGEGGGGGDMTAIRGSSLGDEKTDVGMGGASSQGLSFGVLAAPDGLIDTSALGSKSRSDTSNLVAGVTASSGGGPGQRLRRELRDCDDLIDGTCNLALPVSFPAVTMTLPYTDDSSGEREGGCGNPFRPLDPDTSDRTRSMDPDPCTSSPSSNPFASPRPAVHHRCYTGDVTHGMPHLNPFADSPLATGHSGSDQQRAPVPAGTSLRGRGRRRGGDGGRGPKAVGFMGGRRGGSVGVTAAEITVIIDEEAGAAGMNPFAPVGDSHQQLRQPTDAPTSNPNKQDGAGNATRSDNPFA